MLLKDLTLPEYKIKIRKFLEAQTRPVYESTLLWHVYPEYKNKSSSLDTYQYHIAIMRLLYELQDELEESDSDLLVEEDDD